ncbi:MAG TPA: Ig-like domain-containing protein [Myxococcota bacterium]|nr:Ig-like domain-containing protein [Myxococcota bacterium]
MNIRSKNIWGTIGLILLYCGCGGSTPGENRAPVATDDSYQILEDQTLTVNVASGVLANDSDPDNDSLTAVLAVGPTNGTVFLNVDGSFTYTPDLNFSGTESFAYYASDEVDNSANATVTIVIDPVENRPVAVDDNFEVDEDSPLVVDAVLGVLANDYDPDGDAITAVLTAGPSNGVLDLSDDGSFSYTPDLDYFGTDSFTYEVSADSLESDDATATITINPINDQPAVQNDVYQTDEDTPLTIDAAQGVLANDLDVDGDTLEVIVFASPQNGTLTLNLVGSFEYTPDLDFHGSDVFSYQANDAQSFSVIAQVDISVSSLNDPPLAFDSGGGTPINSDFNGQMGAIDVDGDSLTYSVVVRPTNGSLVEDTDSGFFSYTPNLDYSGQDSFTFTANDGTAGSNTATLTIAVGGTTIPTISSIQPESGPTGTFMQIFGSDFGTQNGAVSVGGRPASVATWSDSYIGVTVPTNYASGSYNVVVNDAADLYSLPAHYQIIPWIWVVEPCDGSTGDSLRLTGDAFGQDTGSVLVDGLAAQVSAWSNMGVQIQIPNGVSSGPTKVHLATSNDDWSNQFPIVIRGSNVWIKDTSPAARNWHSAVWTGTEMIIWGGNNWSNRFQSGARYNPATDSWTPLPELGAPDKRFKHTAVWTGSEMIIWGGADSTGRLGSGARYDPISDSWSPISNVGAPDARAEHTAIWTGSEMIIWGGDALNSGGRYDPVNDSWTPTNIIDAPAGRSKHVAVWTGSQMIVWGGGPNTGSRYDPATDSWSATEVSNAPATGAGYAAVWTGTEMVVWGGSLPGSGGRYDPVADSWETVATENALELRLDRLPPYVVWTGDKMIVWVGLIFSGTFAGSYDPVTDSWAVIERDQKAPEARQDGTALWTGTEMIIWGGYGEDANDHLNSGSRYNPVAASWQAVATNGSPKGRMEHSTIWTQSEMIVWGGWDGVSQLGDGGRYDPATSSWTALNTTDSGGARANHSAVWTGSRMIIWGGDRYSGPLDTGASYSPSTDSWLPISDVDAPAPREYHTAVWTGDEMIVWGGYDRPTQLGDGGRYDPLTDSWQSISNVDAPSERYLHSAVWTGEEMIIWGGQGALNTGARYDPVSDSWSTISTLDAPEGRSDHVAVWTGTEMLVWGGYQSSNPASGGGRYNPVSDTWLALSTVEAPAPLSGRAGVWTGSELIVWGGYNSGYFQDGGRYNLANDSWSPTPLLNAPPACGYPSAIWSGVEMIVLVDCGEAGQIGRYIP